MGRADVKLASKTHWSRFSIEFGYLRMELTLLGGFQLFDDAGNAVALSARKTKALLIWLALHPKRSQPRDRLAMMLWEDKDETQARHSLRQALSGLRKALGEHAGALETGQDQVLLKGGHIRVDALRFDALLSGEHTGETLNEAVSLYGGNFLEGFNPRSNSFDEWLMIQRSHYRERAVGAMSELLDYYLETQQWEQGVRLAIQLLGSDPLQERVHRRLMQLYTRLKRPADALRQYRQCRRVLSRELGVNPEPETQRLHREISRIRAHQVDEAATHTADIDTQDRNDLPLKPEREAETQLRQVTVLHLHMNRFPALMAEEDPEELHLRTRALSDETERLARGFGGKLQHQHADDLAVLFGLPAAHGNECEKAVQMAVELRDIMPAGSTPGNCLPDFQIGIASGSIVSDGKTMASGAVYAHAAQLAESGEPGDILISSSAYQGLRLPLEATRHDASSWRINRIGIDSPEDLRTTPFVGRTRELRQLGAAMEACIEDQAGETFLLRGEAGIGKTRLVEETTRRAEQIGIACHHTQVLDFGVESQTEPIPILMRQLLGIGIDAAANEVEARVKTSLGTGWNEVLHRPALYALFRLPVSREAPETRDPLTGEARRLGQHQLLQGILVSMTRAKPRLLLVDDIHWADQRMLILLAELAAIVSRCAALLIITSRVEGEPLNPEWRSAMHGAPLTTLDLGPIPRDQARTLAGRLTDAETDFVERCIERSGGNPFFLEQLLLETDTKGVEVPDSVQSLVLTRLDLLADEDRIAAQAASVLGQRFRLSTLQHLIGQERYTPDALLDQRLIRTEGESYLFGHALLRDGIYSSLLTTRRRALHLRAAEWYRRHDDELYARHLDMAGDERTAQAYLEASRQAAANLDFERALVLATRGAEVAVEPPVRIQLNLTRGDLLLQAGAIDEANNAFETVAHLTEDNRIHCRALIGLATGLTVRDRLDEALNALDRAEALIRKDGDDALQTELYYRRGDILFAQGRAEECLTAHEQAEKLSRESRNPLLEIRALAGMADAYYARGRMQTAYEYLDRCIELARQEKRLPQELGNLSMRGLTRFYDGSVKDALEDEHESIRLAARYGNLRAEMSGYVDLALIYLYTNQIDDAEQAGRRGLELAQRLGATRFFGDNLVAIGEALVLKGRREEGLQYIEHAYQAALDSVPTHVAPFILGVMARLTTDEERSSWAITEGQRYLDQGSLSHNYLHFYQNLIEIALIREDPESALEYAARLETYTESEPLAWSDFYIARGRLLAQALQRPADKIQRQQAQALLERARIAGLYFGVPELQTLAVE